VTVKRAATSQEAREIAQKVERDMNVAVSAALRIAKFGVRVAVTPKIDLARKFIKAILDEES